MIKKHNWEELYAEYLQSGLSKRSFFIQHHLSLTMAYKSFLKVERSLASQSDCTHTAFDEKNNIFIPLEIKEENIPSDNPSHISGSSILISAGKFTLSVSAASQILLLKDILKVVDALC